MLRYTFETEARIARERSDAPIMCELDDPHVVAALLAARLGCAVLPRLKGLNGVLGLKRSRVESTGPRKIVLVTRGALGPLDQIAVPECSA